MLECMVHAADIRDRRGAEKVLIQAENKYPRMKVVFVDQAYHSSDLGKWVQEKLEWRMEVVKRDRKSVV